MDEYYKHPRLHVEQSLSDGKDVPLPEAQAHYLRTVLRKNAGDHIRLFNEKDGEWLATLSATEKRTAIAHCTQLIHAPQMKERHVHLLFPPLAKDRLDFLIEKSVELGVTDLWPVLTRRTEVRRLNEERVRAQIIEASEQCERRDIPLLHPLMEMGECLGTWDDHIPLYTALEREDAAPLAAQKGHCALLVGPPGGFADEEKILLQAIPFVKPVTLGPRILRTETAALFSLSILTG